MKKTITTLLVLFSILQAYAQVPNSFTYQGIATRSNDTPLANKDLSFKISILAGSIIGTPDYVETHSKITTSSNGVFTLIIGNGSPATGTFAAINWNATTKYLKVEMDTTNSINFQLIGSPTLLQSVPFALQAANTAKIQGVNISTTAPINGQVLTYDGSNWIPKTPTTYTQGTGIAISGTTISTDLVGTNGVSISGKNISGSYNAGNNIVINGNTIGVSNNLVPAGTVVSFAGDTAQIPTGWLLCNGKYIDKTTYSALYANIKDIWGTAAGNTFALPDLRGQFLRGAAFNVNVDPDQAGRTGGGTGVYKIGSKQTNQIQTHNHNQLPHNHGVYDPGHVHQGISTQWVSYPNGSGAGTGTTSYNAQSTNTATSNVTIVNATASNVEYSGTETRPVNVYVHYIIKY